MSRLAAALTCVALTCAAPSWAQPVPAAVVSDPAPDAAHPPRMASLTIPSPTATAPDRMNGVFYLAPGPGAHPTMVLMHGLPGNEKNLDVAQSVRRAGWNVLVFHYRGAWGSGGAFSITHAMEDVKAVLAFLNEPAVATRYGVDRGRIVLAGHSMGGFAAASAARENPIVAGLVLIDATDFGPRARRTAPLDAAARTKALENSFDLTGLAGVTPIALFDEVADSGAAWDVMTWVPALTRTPMLVVGAERGNGRSNRAFADAVLKAGGRAALVILPTDHGFSDHRIALQATIVRWLAAFPAP